MYTKKLSGTDEAFALMEDDPDAGDVDMEACEVRTAWDGDTEREGVWEEAVWEEATWEETTWEIVIWEDETWEEAAWTEEAWDEETWEEETWEPDTREEATREAWDADDDWIEADVAWEADAGWFKAELLCAADARVVDALLTGILLPRIRGWLVDDTVVIAAWEEDDNNDDTNEDDTNEDDANEDVTDDDDGETELTEALPVDPEALGLIFEDPGTFRDELLDSPCDSTTDRLVVEVVGFVPTTPTPPLVRVTIGFVLVDDERDWLLADDETNRLLGDEVGSSTAMAPGSVVTLEDKTTEDDLALTTPLVRVI
jgi:hypothetical protein